MFAGWLWALKLFRNSWDNVLSLPDMSVAVAGSSLLHTSCVHGTVSSSFPLSACFVLNAILRYLHPLI